MHVHGFQRLLQIAKQRREHGRNGRHLAHALEFLEQSALGGSGIHAPCLPVIPVVLVMARSDFTYAVAPGK
jgi:hypothetical protein